ncbi:MAG: alpha/beta fold hydrolase [Acidimicrobiales bacterium]
MSSGAHPPRGLHAITDSPVPGLALTERRVDGALATVICIHGGLDRGGSFARLARRSESFNVVAYDRRGYQGSRSLAPLTLQDHIDDLLAIAECEASLGPVIFFGHSFGGVIALGAVIASPSSAQLVIAYESPLPWVLQRESSRPALTNDPHHEAEVFFRRMVSNSAWERLSAREQQSRRLDGPALLSDLSTLRTGGVAFDLADLKTPTLYLHGDGVIADYYRELGVRLRALNPLIDVRELANATHGAHLSSPDQLSLVIRETWESLCESA